MKVRVRFTRLGKIRFTSHRDIARIWERAVRRAQLPMAYSQGFTPRPRLSFGLALSTGYESLAEYLDIELDATGVLAADAGDADVATSVVDLAVLPDVLSDALPTGLDVTAVAVVEAGTESLQQAVTSCTWDIVLRDITVPVVDAAISRVLTADHLPVTRERKGKPVQDDLRPGVLELVRVDHGVDQVLIRAELGAQPRALRPSELLAVMELGDHEGLVRRTHQWMNDGHERREPLAADVARRLPDLGDAWRRDDDHVRSTGLPDLALAGRDPAPGARDGAPGCVDPAARAVAGPDAGAPDGLLPAGR